MYDPRRLLGPFGALVLVTALLAAFGVLLRPVAGGRPAWLPPSDSTMEPTAFKEAAGRIAGVLRSDRARGGPPKERRIGVLLGTSTLQCAIDPALLDPKTQAESLEAGSGLNWLSLHAVTVNIADIEWMTHRLLDDLTPAAVVLAINPGTLARSVDYLSDPTSLDTHSIREHLKAKDKLALKEDAETALLVPWNRLFPNRSRIGHRFHRGLYELRFALFSALGYPIDAQFAPNSDPWASMTWTRDEAMPGSFLLYQMEGWRHKGWFDPANFNAEGPNYQALARMVKTFRAESAAVVVVLLPETRQLREAVPGEAVATLHAAFAKEFGSDPPPVIDLREAVPDDLFADADHLMPKGRKSFSPLVAAALRDALRDKISAPRTR